MLCKLSVSYGGTALLLKSKPWWTMVRHGFNTVGCNLEPDWRGKARSKGT